LPGDALVHEYHHFTVDVEEFFQVVALQPFVPRERWDSFESRVEAAIDRLLALLDGAGATGTFFTLGWVAQRKPAMLRRITSAGHEVASHGWGHRRITFLTPETFRDSVRRARDVLQDVTGQPVHGYRAPSYSITPGREWALDILVEEGYTYDSSLFPVRRSGYGFPGGARHPSTLQLGPGKLREFPPTTLAVGPIVLPAAGGAYFRLLPYALVRAGLRQAARDGHPGTFYIHPWEIDPGQPRLGVDFLTRIRHYGGLGRTEGKLRRLLRQFRFRSIATTLEADGAGAAAPARTPDAATGRPDA
jgi:polysaccharide deacetylase family protein (PEP-CTERM system associated)